MPKLEDDLYGAQRKVWGMLRRSKQKLNEYVETQAIDEQIWHAYFEELYKNKKQEETNARYKKTSVTALITIATEKRPIIITEGPGPTNRVIKKIEKHRE